MVLNALLKKLKTPDDEVNFDFHDKIINLAEAALWKYVVFWYSDNSTDLLINNATFH